ncbi:MAG: hypothetical protein LBL92_01780 [Propionibacteriaceae bacterium]|jgi:hypothetical protein|nr:hypothetical protein [Propionibacteriaceae bacterium]
MSDSEVVRLLQDQLRGLRMEVRRLNAKTGPVPESHLAVIAAAAAAYLGEDANRQQPHFPSSSVWSGNTRRAQHAHHPSYR